MGYLYCDVVELFVIASGRVRSSVCDLLSLKMYSSIFVFKIYCTKKCFSA